MVMNRLYGTVDEMEDETAIPVNENETEEEDEEESKKKSKKKKKKTIDTKEDEWTSTEPAILLAEYVFGIYADSIGKWYLLCLWIHLVL